MIAPQHRDPERVGVRERLATTGVAHIDDFLDEGAAEAVGSFLVHDARFLRRYLLYPGTAVTAARWKAAAEEERFSREETLVGIRTNDSLGGSIRAFLQLRTSLRGEHIRRWLEGVSGVPLAPAHDAETGVVTRMRAGDVIGPHDDRVEGRAVALVLHFSRDWRHDNGGQLVVTGGSEQRVSTVETSWNRAVLITAAGQRRHEVTAVCGHESRRHTIAGWYRHR